MPDVFPNEAFPSDAAVALLDGTTDNKTGLSYIAKGVGPASVPSYEVQYNRRQQRANRRLALAAEGLVVDEGSLKVGVYPFNYTFHGVRKRFAGATNQSVPDNSTRYVYVDSSNAIQIATAYPAGVSACVPLSKITTAGGAMTIEPEIGYARAVVAPAAVQIAVTVGVESANTIAVTLQLQEADGTPLARRWLAEVWLSGSAYGDLVATAPSGGVTVATGQQLGAQLVTGKHLKIVSTADGQIIINLVEAGATAFYLMAVGGGADLVAGGPITFA